MKENVFEVLMYLFENYFHSDDEPRPDREDLESSLSEVGFTPTEIRKAFVWLDGLADERRTADLPLGDNGPMRLYADAEEQKLDRECRGFLLFLEQVGILSASARELVIDRAMALDEEEIDLDTLKWVILMVLFNSPGQEEAYVWLENLLFDSPAELVH
ncbi:DUF494 family protein [Alkalilimnicola sp. S0819]|uniref:DUF494 family protein n=1 Tax=Alkalilimnicola sp. S0819 TaxID=2613922 RepID=UPI0012621B34|nr:DUF494 family protein [Alkalilimnicola sp. S0819]KAB7627239.1 DUF494 domain-containing protein [Alkalilimnicola sp. S0819]MPQ15952.1 DUF494 family protein [Alkalilimnicola sp. S0819]